MLNELADQTRMGDEIWRYIYSDTEKKGKKIIRQWMEALGLLVIEDQIGNLIARKEGKSKETIVIGSHMDTVKDGGKYDGAGGIVIGLLALKELIESDETFDKSIEIIAFTEEEGSRFLSGYLGSKNLVGKITQLELNDTDSDGISLKEAMISNGYDPEKLPKEKRRDVAAYLEVHIEQGPVLETLRHDIGIVESIVGIRAFDITIKGRQDHAGTTPMDIRLDPVYAASKFISETTDYVRRLSKTATFTIGAMSVLPGVSNVIADSTNFSIDLRDRSEEDLVNVTDRIYESLGSLEEQGYAVTIKLLCAEEPVDLDSRLSDFMYDKSQNLGLRTMKMVSGAGHDAQIIAPHIKTGLIFVPSVKGRSHSSDEYTKSYDLGNGVLLLATILKEMLQGEFDV
nr:M20 family metallo-hydrolase [Acidaminobacter sp. JC074]